MMLMKAFLSALATVSRLRIVQDESPAGGVAQPDVVWVVLARTLLAVVATLAAALVLWLVKDQLIAALLATAAFCAVRQALSAVWEREGVVVLLHKLRSGHPLSETERYYRNALFNLLLILRPLAIFFLCLRHACLWLIPSAALATAIMVELTWPRDESSDSDSGSGLSAGPRHWLAAAAIVLVATGLGSRLAPEQDGMFILGLLAAIFAWLLPAMMAKAMPPRDFGGIAPARAAYLYLGELAVLVLGLLGLAL